MCGECVCECVCECVNEQGNIEVGRKHAGIYANT